MQNSIVFLLTNHKLMRKEPDKQFHSKFPQKYLGINLTERVNDLSNKYYKTLLRQVEEGTRRSSPQCSWIEKINIVKMAILVKVIYRLKIKIPFFTGTER